MELILYGGLKTKENKAAGDSMAVGVQSLTIKTLPQSNTRWSHHRIQTEERHQSELKYLQLDFPSTLSLKERNAQKNKKPLGREEKRRG